VVLVPSKLAVYYKHVEAHPEVKNYEELMEWGEYERRMNQMVRLYFQDHGISFVDVLEPMQEAAARDRIYPGNADTHPNKNGYRIIAGVIAAYLDGGQHPGIEEEESGLER